MVCTCVFFQVEWFYEFESISEISCFLLLLLLAHFAQMTDAVASLHSICPEMCENVLNSVDFVKVNQQINKWKFAKFLQSLHIYTNFVNESIRPIRILRCFFSSLSCWLFMRTFVHATQYNYRYFCICLLFSIRFFVYSVEWLWHRLVKSVWIVVM